MAGLQASESYYEILDGTIYDKVLLKAAEDASTDGEIGYEAAKCLWTQVGDDAGRVSDVDLRTVDYILKRHKFERTAVYFLKEAVKLEKQRLKVKEKEEAKAARAAGLSPQKKSPKKSPLKSPKMAKARVATEEPFHAILRITEEISQASSVTQVKRLQRELALLSPMKEDPEKATAEKATPAKKTTGRGRGSAKAHVEESEVVHKKAAVGSLRKGESKKLMAGKKVVLKKPVVTRAKKAAAAASCDESEEAVVLKKPAAATAAVPVVTRAKKAAQTEKVAASPSRKTKTAKEVVTPPPSPAKKAVPPPASPAKKDVLKRPAGKEAPASPLKKQRIGVSMKRQAVESAADEVAQATSEKAQAVSRSPKAAKKAKVIKEAQSPKAAKKAKGKQDNVVSFEVSGKLGVAADPDTGVITAVNEGRAKELGFQIGWKFASIDDKPYSAELLKAKIVGGKAYRITIQKGAAKEAPQEEKQKVLAKRPAAVFDAD